MLVQPCFFLFLHCHAVSFCRKVTGAPFLSLKTHMVDYQRHRPLHTHTHTDTAPNVLNKNTALHTHSAAGKGKHMLCNHEAPPSSHKDTHTHMHRCTLAGPLEDADTLTEPNAERLEAPELSQTWKRRVLRLKEEMILCGK